MKINAKSPSFSQSRGLSNAAQEDCLVAAGKSDISGLNSYLEQGGPVDEKIYTRSWPMGIYPLALACIRYQTESVRWLLAHGANPNNVKIKDEWLLISVIAMSQLDIFSERVDRCSLDVESKHGLSILEIAEMSAHCPDGEKIYDKVKAIFRKRKQRSSHQEDILDLTRKCNGRAWRSKGGDTVVGQN